MQHCHSEHFKKHKRWCGTHFVDHEFKACVYNPDRVARKEIFEHLVVDVLFDFLFGKILARNVSIIVM